jgi:hypothetical protein
MNSKRLPTAIYAVSRHFSGVVLRQPREHAAKLTPEIHDAASPSPSISMVMDGAAMTQLEGKQ